jgi:hypothetical protein
MRLARLPRSKIAAFDVSVTNLGENRNLFRGGVKRE